MQHGRNGLPVREQIPARKVTNTADMPDWFRNGVNAAFLAPAAVNQQKFTFTLDGNKVSTKAGIGFYTKVDLGIVKCHFEIGAGKDNFMWAQWVSYCGCGGRTAIQMEWGSEK